MSSQTSLTTRRQFLHRSAWGFGSAFVLPSLLASCTDHLLPPTGPVSPVIPTPSLGDDQIDWNDDAKLVVSTALSFVPEVGGILSALTTLLWPSNNQDVWGEIKTQVEALIDQKIGNTEYINVRDKLISLGGEQSSLKTYLSEVKNGTSAEINSAWMSVKGDFGDDIGDFQQDGSGYEILLLPLYAQFINMQLAILRDGVISGKDWGRTDDDHENDKKLLTDAISDAQQWVTKTYGNYLTQLAKNIKQDDKVNEPFRTTNRFTRQMTLWVLDYMDTWDYYNVTKHPNGAYNPDGTPVTLFNREIYSDPYGNTYAGDFTSNPIILPPPATQRPSQITVWGGHRIDAVQLTYPAGGGPGGVTQTPRMGDQKGGTSQAQAGGTFTLSLDNPFIQAQVSYDTSGLANFDDGVIEAMLFTYSDGTNTYQMGREDIRGANPPSRSGGIGYFYQALSSIYIPGFNAIYGDSANCIIFGFLYWQSPAATLRALSRIYITSPKEHSAADFAKAFPKLSLTEASITDELKKARQTYWARIKARAHK